LLNKKPIGPDVVEPSSGLVVGSSKRAVISSDLYDSVDSEDLTK